jgi:hypothetical protein
LAHFALAGVAEIRCRPMALLFVLLLGHVLGRGGEHGGLFIPNQR